MKVDERECAEAGAAGGVGYFDVGNFCGISGCRLAGPNGVISSETTSGGETGACLLVFCCGTFFLYLLSLVWSATKFESPSSERGDVEEGGVERMSSSEHPGEKKGGTSERPTGKEGEEGEAGGRRGEGEV